MYYTVWNTERRGHHLETPKSDRLVLDPRQATQFATWVQATARAGALMTATDERHTVQVHDWGGETHA